MVGTQSCHGHSQRVMASVAAEFLKLQASGALIRFCRLLDQVGFIEVPFETVRRCVNRLIDAKSSLPLGGPFAYDLPDVEHQPAAKGSPFRKAQSEVRKRVRAALRLAYGSFSRAAEPNPRESKATAKAWVKSRLRRVEYWCLRKWCRADAIFQDGDVLLNMGSAGGSRLTWQRWQPSSARPTCVTRRSSTT